MYHRPWRIILLTIFSVAVLAAGYFINQLRHPALDLPRNPLAAEKGYGVTIDLTQYDNLALTNTLTALRENNLVWLRQPVRWAEIERSPGAFDWRPLDRVFMAIRQANQAAKQADSLAANPPPFRLIVVLHTTPAWARAPHRPPATPPTNLSDFGNFANRFAARYGRQIDFYQVWDEPNLSANWGYTFVEPAAYADLLREAALNIRAADSNAHLLLAALAPTLEDGPLNLNEFVYLEQLYQARANRWFDIVAVQPYGFDKEATNPAQTGVLNFSRAELVRQMMLNHGDSETPLWATAFGWNALPSDWSGPKSPWKSGPARQQARRTEQAIDFARRNWPWLGPMLAIRWDTTNLTKDDPVRGFALADTPSILQVVRSKAADYALATPGYYPPNHPSGRYSSNWRVLEAGADAPRQSSSLLTIPFEGTRFDLTLNRGPYRGYLWVTIDGQPANALPRDSQGNSYVVLYDPLREQKTMTLAQDLSPGRHQALIKTEGGSGQWVIAGWSVYNEINNRSTKIGLSLAALLIVISGGALWGVSTPAPFLLFNRVGAWGKIRIIRYTSLEERQHILITFALAIIFYLTPSWVAILILPILALAILLRPDLGLAVVIFSLSFFQARKQLSFGDFSPVELALTLTVAGFVVRWLLTLDQIFSATQPNNQTAQTNTLSNLLIHLKSKGQHLTSIDWAALSFVAWALLATLFAKNFGVSMLAWRLIVFEPILFYFLVRLGGDFGSPTSFGWAWRLINAFVAGATLQASIALYLYAFTTQTVVAEGVRRAMGLAYGSPNNLALFLDRAWPLLLAIAVFSDHKSGRRLYWFGFIVVSLALYLTFSKGALLIGLPAGAITMLLWYTIRNRPSFRWQSMALVGAALLTFIFALIPLSQTKRFYTALDLSQGSTAFFRLKLWDASLRLLQDHWFLGIGLNNFLYQYRTRYILPEAWQEPNLSHPHNLILDFGTQLGFSGILILLWLQIAFWSQLWRLYRRSNSPLILGLAGAMMVILSHGLVDHVYFLVDLAFVFFLIVGVVQGLAQE